MAFSCFTIPPSITPGSSTPFLGSSDVRDHRVEFYNDKNTVVAKIFQRDEKIREVVLEKLSIRRWSYSILPDFARQTVDEILPQNSTDETDRKIKRLASGKLLPGDDSDAEFIEEPLQKPFIFKREIHIPAKSMTISCLDKNIKGSELISTVHALVQREYTQIDEFCESEKDDKPQPPSEKEGVLCILGSEHWLITLGGWKGMMPKTEVKEYFLYHESSVYDKKSDSYVEPPPSKKKFQGVRIYDTCFTFPIRENRIYLPEGFSINEVDITKKASGKIKADLSYPQIVKVIDLIKSSFSLEDHQIAALQLWTLSRRSPRPDMGRVAEQNLREIICFLDYLNALMFGIEPSGLNAALTIGLMILDLIVEGQCDYRTAFFANGDGGIYPYASFVSNEGTYTNRAEIVIPASSQSFHSMKSFRKEPGLSPVAIKEAILIKEWLKYNQVIQERISHSEQRQRIERAIEGLFQYYFYCLFQEDHFMERFLPPKKFTHK